MSGQRILVTGGTGFLGRAVVKALRQQGDEPVVLSRRPGEEFGPSVAVDLTDAGQTRAALAGHNFDAVCHLAARTNGRESMTDPLGYWTANLTATVNLLANVEPGTPVVLASTGAVYAGDVEGALDEDTPVRPSNPYGASKYAAEEVARAWSTATNSPLTVLRCFNIAGAVDGYGDPDRTRIIPAIIDVAMGRVETFTVNGDGSTVRDYCHVLDVADAFAQAVVNPVGKSRIFNVGTSEGLSIVQIIDAAKHVTGRQVRVRQTPCHQESSRLVADNRLIVSTLGWLPIRSSARDLVRDAWVAAIDFNPNR